MVFDEERREKLESFQKPLRLWSPVRFDVPRDHVHPGNAESLRRLKHCVCLAHSGHIAEEDFESPSTQTGFVSLYLLEKLIGIWTVFFHQTSPAESFAGSACDGLRK